MAPTDVTDPNYFHKVVDCQWACPAHTPVPEYIRLIAAGRYSDAYMINWHSNVFPGRAGPHLRPPLRAGLPARARRGRAGRDLPPEARRRRLRRTTSSGRMPKPAAQKNGKRIALIGAGPASLTVARDLLPLGYHVTIYDADPFAGGMMRTQIPKFRLPESVLDEECNYILDLEPETKFGQRIDSLKSVLNEGLRRDLRRLRRAARTRSRDSRPQGSGARTSISASTGCRRFRSAIRRRSASA